ncbi:MAG TPA: hypothetical protein VIH43_06530 [Chthoniobacterales bacterium]
MRQKSVLAWVEWFLGIALTLVAITLHLRLLRHAGPLWRDEISSLNLAMAANFSEFWTRILPDNFPAMFFVLLRGWCSLGLCGSDLHLRIVGCLLGLATISTTWIVCRVLNGRAPIWPLALMAVAALTFQCHDQLRPYGLSVLLVTASYGVFWQLAREHSQNWRLLLLGAAVATLAVQTSYTNSVFIFALGLAGAVIAISRGAQRAAINIIAGGTVAALSLLPYLVSFSANHRWLVILPGAKSFAAVFSVLHDTLVLNHWSMPWIWAGVLAISLLCLVFAFRSGAERGEKEILSFAAVALFVAAILTLLFFRMLHWQMHPRYFFPLLCFATLCFHILLNPLRRASVWRILMIAAAIAIAIVQIPWAYRDCEVRPTNVDAAADALSQDATADDFILLTGFWLGLSFDRYYHGPASWKSIPDINDFSSYRWDEAMQAMSTPDPLHAIFQEIEKTLQTGHKVFLVGSLAVQLPPTKPDPLPPAPESVYGWELQPYMANWQIQIGYFLEHHALHGDPISIDLNQPVYDLEKVQIFAVSGYHDRTP